MSAPASHAAPARSALPWLLAACGFAFDLLAWWPGQMSFDSAYAWWQARGGAGMNTVPPAFVALWRLLDPLLPGPGVMFVLHLLLYWSGVALLARVCERRGWAIAVIFVAALLAPVPLLMRGHVWTDVGLLSALTFAAGVLAHADAGQHGRRAWLAVPALLYAAAVRHNALPAVLPFALWCAWLLPARRPPARAHVLLAGTALFAAIGLAAFALNARGEHRVPLWAALAQYDLAALSIADNQMLLPPWMIGDGLDVDELARAFHVWANTSLYETRHGMLDPYTHAYAPTELADLRERWFAAIAAHPGNWLRHRAAVAGALFGTHARDWPHELIFFDGEARYEDTPVIAANTGALHRALMQRAHTAAGTALLAAWPYLLAGLAAAWPAWRRRDSPRGRAVLALLGSAALYALPLPFVVMSAELRFTAWSCVACLLGALLILCAPRAAGR